MSESTSGSGTKTLVEVVVAVVLVVALASVAIGVLSWLAGAFWLVVKLAVLALACYLIVRVLLRRHR